MGAPVGNAWACMRPRYCRRRRRLSGNPRNTQGQGRLLTRNKESEDLVTPRPLAVTSPVSPAHACVTSRDQPGSRPGTWIRYIEQRGLEGPVFPFQRHKRRHEERE